jgi:hypothetical protein
VRRLILGILYKFRRLLPVVVPVCSLLLDSASATLAQTWTATSLPSTEYLRVASSADGTTLLAGTYDGPIYASTNSGTTWMALSPPVPPGSFWEWLGISSWHGLATSADGSTIVAAAADGGICVSTNLGVTWSETISSDLFQGVACSADGKRLVTVADHSFSPSSSGIYLSNDGGINWTEAIAPGSLWLSVACSADGTTIVAGGSSVYVSTNSGVTWNPTSLPGGACRCIACSADGTKMIAGTYAPGGLFTSTDSGATWTGAGFTNGDFFAVASSANGNKLAAAVFGGPIFLSADSGVTWTPTEAPPTNWYAIAASADGNALVAASMDINRTYLGLVYTSQSIPAPRLNLIPSGENLILSWTLPSRKFVLQQNSDLSTPNWIDVTTVPVLNCTNLQNQATVPAAPGRMFYRLVSR